MTKKVITPFNPSGFISIPTSKSEAHRYLIAAFLSRSNVEISNVDLNDDVEQTLLALKAMGAKVTHKKETKSFVFSPYDSIPSEVVFEVKNSASTLRFLLPLATSVCSHVKITGSKQVFSRPLDFYESMFKENKIDYILKAHSIEIFSRLPLSSYLIKSDIPSSQFASGILFALYGEKILNNDKTKHYLTIEENMQSQGYLDLTIKVLNEFGADIRSTKSFTATTYAIEDCSQPKFISKKLSSDCSSLAFILALGVLKGHVSFEYIGETLQPDKQIFSIIKRMGGNYEINSKNIVICLASKLIGTQIDISECIDLGPILCVLASYAKGTTHLTHAKRLIYKESNRMQVMLEELQKAGVAINASEDEITIEGNESYTGNVHFNVHNDHRIAMALTIFSLNCKEPCTINNSECVNKSYPNFWKDIESLQGE